MSATMDQLEARLARQLDALQSANERLAAITVTETSPDGEVTATVSGTGALTDLAFSDGVRRLKGSALSTLVVATAQVACQKALARRARIMQDFNEEFADLVSPPADDGAVQGD